MQLDVYLKKHARQPKSAWPSYYGAFAKVLLRERYGNAVSLQKGNRIPPPRGVIEPLP